LPPAGGTGWGSEPQKKPKKAWPNMPRL